MSLQNETTPLWYVIHTYSGYENKVATNIEKIVENRGLQNMIFDVRIPTETVVEKSAIQPASPALWVPARVPSR